MKFKKKIYIYIYKVVTLCFSFVGVGIFAFVVESAAVMVVVACESDTCCRIEASSFESTRTKSFDSDTFLNSLTMMLPQVALKDTVS